VEEIERLLGAGGGSLTRPVRASRHPGAPSGGYADRGIGRYVSAYAVALARAGRVGGDPARPELPPPFGLPGELVAADLVGWDSIATTRRLLAEPDRPRLPRHGTFLHAGPDDPPAWPWPALGPSGVRRVVSLYDLIPLRGPRHYLPTPAHRSATGTGRLGRAAELVLAISEYTRREAIDLLGCAPERW